MACHGVLVRFVLSCFFIESFIVLGTGISFTREHQGFSPYGFILHLYRHILEFTGHSDQRCAHLYTYSEIYMHTRAEIISLQLVFMM